MKINPINISLNVPKLDYTNTNKSLYSKESNHCTQLSKYNNITFQGNYLKYLSAKKYATETIQPQIKKFPDKIFDLWNFDLKKLDGIQYEIKVFEKLSIKDIAFFLSTVAEIATFRGCHNNCAHCYADAKPPVKETASKTNGMTWEDFTNLMDGIETLNKRVGFFASGKNKRNKYRYLTPFHDSDCMEISMKDKNGNVYDFIDIAKRLYKAMGVRVIFDTAGWNPKSQKYQEKAEKYVEFLSKPQNKKMFYQINVSLNPFHAIHRKEIELRKENKNELADKMRDYYTTRMANVFFTFTPLIKQKKLNLIAAATPNRETFEGYQYKDLYKLYDEITDKLWELYEKDLNGEQKYIKSEKDMDRCIHNLNNKFDGYRYITFAKKTNKTLNPDKLTQYNECRKNQSSINRLRELKQNYALSNKYFVGIIDANGKYYLTDFRTTAPTEIKLNFENNKETASINPNLQEDLIITKKDIQNIKQKKA